MFSRFVLMVGLFLILGLMGPDAAFAKKDENNGNHFGQIAVAAGEQGRMVAGTPEPSSMLLMAAGGVVLALALRRRCS